MALIEIRDASFCLWDGRAIRAAAAVAASPKLSYTDAGNNGLSHSLPSLFLCSGLNCNSKIFALATAGKPETKLTL